MENPIYWRGWLTIVVILLAVAAAVYLSIRRKRRQVLADLQVTDRTKMAIEAAARLRNNQ